MSIIVNKELPHFIVKKNLQKSRNTGIYFSDRLTEAVLSDVCKRITDQDCYDVDFVENDYQDVFLENTYNKGRLAILHYKGTAHYVSFSESSVNGRNSSVQSVPTAFNLYYCNQYPFKKLHYYFLDVQTGNLETEYLKFMYRLMSTIGFNFLNDDVALSQRIQNFISIEDIMFNRRISSWRNQSNNSTYITKSGVDTIDIYGKVYGANKYETSMLCYALSKLRNERQILTLYEVLDNDLDELPKISRRVINEMGVIRIVPTNMTLEKKHYDEDGSLRSPRYIYNLLDRLGPKQCALCNCGIQELVQGAHIWPVSQIKKEVGMSDEDKLKCAIDGDNGLWLCENHHKLFDENLIRITESGAIYYKETIPQDYSDFISEITLRKYLPDSIMTEQFKEYLRRRNNAI